MGRMQPPHGLLEVRAVEGGEMGQFKLRLLSGLRAKRAAVVFWRL